MVPPTKKPRTEVKITERIAAKTQDVGGSPANEDGKI